MLIKTITYTDLDGNSVSEDFHFHINKAELIELEVSRQGGFESFLKAVVEADNQKEIFAAFKEIILMAVGRRSSDGKRFIKSQDIRDEFEQTEAFSSLITEFMSDEGGVASAFVNGIMPHDSQTSKPVAKAKKKTPVKTEAVAE